MPARPCIGRRLLVHPVRVDSRPVAHVAKELGVSRQCAHLWVAGLDTEGEAGLLGRSSRPHHSPTRIPARTEGRVITARHGCRVVRPGWLAAGVPAVTCGRIPRRYGLPQLVDCGPQIGPIRATTCSSERYERERPGELVHVDVKKFGASFRTAAAGADMAAARPSRTEASATTTSSCDRRSHPASQGGQPSISRLSPKS